MDSCCICFLCGWVQEFENINTNAINTKDNCFIVFGKESYGLSETLLKNNYDRCIRIPMISNAEAEFYDTFIDKNQAPYRRHEENLCQIKESLKIIPQYNNGAHWYDFLHLPMTVQKKAKKCGVQFNKAFEAMLAEYVNLVKDAEVLAGNQFEEKRQKVQFLAEGLLTNGGPAVNTFNRLLGAEKTADFIRHCFFGL